MTKKTATKSNVPTDTLVTAARVSFRKEENAKWVQARLPPDKVKAEVKKRLVQEFPNYAGIADAVVEAVIERHNQLWGYTERGLHVTNYSEVLLFIGSPAGIAVVNEVGMRIAALEQASYDALRARRAERRARMNKATGGKLFNLDHFRRTGRGHKAA